MKYIALTLCCLLLTCFGWSAQNSQHLFYMARSKNANIVRYDALLDPDGTISSRKPVEAYWVLLAKDGSREELSAFDKKAYGFTCTPDKSTKGYRLIIKPFPQRPISFYRQGDQVRTEIAINGEPAFLEKIYIDASSTLLIPKVHFIELFGKDKKTGAPAFEKINI